MLQVNRPIPGSVVIVGGGFSGSLLAINLLRDEGAQVTVIERRPVFGRGTAYSAPNPHHLLNVRAGNMSAFPDQPRHFADWCVARGHGDGTRFVGRDVFGAYIGELLGAVQASAPGRLTLVSDAAVAASADGGGIVVELAGGGTVSAETLVLATGNLPPQIPAGVTADLCSDRFVTDPWASNIADGLAPDDPVLLLGTGLTMVDVALALTAAGHRGRVLALSRRGLLPHRHAPAEPGDRNERPTTRASHLVRDVRRRAAAIGWRAAVDELRPFTQALWRAASPAERARFLRHLRPWWDIHRHRLAPEVADRIAGLQAEGRLTVAAGRPREIVADGDGVRVSWCRRGGGTAETRVRRIINCTGPLGDLRRTGDPLLQGLMAARLARPDPFGLGLDVDAQSRLIDSDGRAHRQLYAIGPLTRGAFWEIVAVPDIRKQVWSLARQLTGAHWVGGEGL